MDRRQEVFFKHIFGPSSGYVCIAHRNQNRLVESYFYYPDELVPMLEHIARQSLDQESYFCPQLLGTKKRTKENIQTVTNAWSDLDTCSPELCLVKPTLSWQTSAQKFQAVWVFDKPVPAEAGEDISRRIAYYHADDGADKTGWDLTQLLRIPYTTNFKYDEPYEITILEANQRKYRISDFKEYPQSAGYEYLEVPFPDEFPNVSANDILETVKRDINPHVWELFHVTPSEDWSKKLWELELLLFEAGLDREHVFLVAEASACNKYKRDNKPRTYLWQEVCKAYEKFNSRQQFTLEYAVDTEPIVLLSEKEKATVASTDSFISDYTEWAKGLGDAAWQYHEAAAFVVLSSLLAGFVKLPTSFGVVLPNLWVMILGDTTLTRKTTAMDLAVELILEIDTQCVLATDGSIEGLMTSLSTRPGRSSIFLRDEFSGLLEQISKRDYYAGMAETLTKLYDGKFQKRVLRKEIIEIRDPVLIVFAGGIRSRVYELLDYQHIASGFLPRFVFITAESDVTRLRPLGPPTDKTTGERDSIIRFLTKMREHYDTQQVLTVSGKSVMVQKNWNAALTDEAWLRYNKMEAMLVERALGNEQSDLLVPTMDRLAKSGLKMAVLLAATRLESSVIVTEEDIVHAFYYIERWSNFTLDVLYNIGKTTSERLLDRVLNSVRRHPGIARSTLMQSYHLTSREADSIFDTLEQRGQIIRTKVGKGYKYEPVG